MQGLALDARFPLQGACRRGRRREPGYVVALLLGQGAEPVEHRGLAGAGITPHTDHPVLCGEDDLDCFLLTLVKPAAVELGLRNPALHDRLGLALAGLHQGDGLGLLRQRRVRGPVLAVPETGGGVKATVPLHRADGQFGVLDGDGAGIARKGGGQKAGMREHGRAFAEMVHRPARARGRHQVAVGTVIAADEDILVLLHPAVFGLSRRGNLDDAVGREAQFRRLARPVLPKRVLIYVPLVRPRHERRPIRKLRIVDWLSEVLRLHRRLDLGPPRRECIDHPARHTGELESTVRMGLLNLVSEVRQPPCQLRPVDGTDGHLACVEPVIDHSPPLALAAPDHVRDDAMGMELGIQVARGVVTEGGRHHVLPAGPDHRAGGRIPYPGLDGVGLDPCEGALHGLVVRPDDPMVATDKSRKRDRLRCRQGDVAARPVVDITVLVPSAELRASRHLAFEDGGESLWINGTR